MTLSFDRTKTGRLILFSTIGSIGFAVDAGILIVLIPSIGHYAGRMVSFSVAVLVTWVLNRSLTFRDRRSAKWGRELLSYVSAQSIGAMTNLAAYAVCITVSLWLMRYPVVALAIGSAFGLLVNFTMMHLVVFRRAR